MKAAVPRRVRCPTCRVTWHVESDTELCPTCDEWAEPICACPCEASLSGMRADAVYRSDACAKRLLRAGRPDRDPTRHPLDDARGQVEEGRTAAEWALLAREHVMRTLLETGYFTADDLDSLGIPEHHRRSVHGLVTAYFRGPEPYMEEAGRRKSERPERKGAKNTVFRISARGRRELPKLLEGLTAGTSAGNQARATGGSGDPAGEPYPANASASARRGRVGVESCAGSGSQPREEAGGSEGHSQEEENPEPARLFPDEEPEQSHSMYDAWRDSEAAA